MVEIVKMEYGSKLYGTFIPGVSDLDYKGVFLPSREDLLLGKIPKSIVTTTKYGDGKNSSEDVDIELYSLHYFIELACKGETVALDMLHAPFMYCLFGREDIWFNIKLNKNKFYTKNLKAFMGYCRTQAAKYGVKGSRLADAERVLRFLENTGKSSWVCGSWKNLSSIWHLLPEGEHIRKYYDEQTKLHFYEVCGKKIQETALVSYAHDIVKRFYDNYGERAKLAKENKGIDWKAVSHAIRVAYEMREIYKEGNITFPLRERDYIMKVKLGELDYTNIVAPKLEELIDEVEVLAAKSTYPEKVDRKWWDEFIIKTMEDYVL